MKIHRNQGALKNRKSCPHILIHFGMLVLCSTSALAQNGSITGNVMSEGRPVEFVTVALTGTGHGTSSGIDGSYKIDKIPFGEYRIAVSALGYEEVEKKVILDVKNPEAEIRFSLKPKIDQLDEVVISGTLKEVSKKDSPVPVEVYTAAYFKANPTPSLFESMQNVNGVRPQLNCNVCNTGDIHINGLEGPYTMVLIDGMPIVSGLSTVYGLTGIPQSLIERVEIVKGPASTLYGSEAVGGLINIITKNPEKAPLVSADVFSTTWGEVNSDLGLKFSTGKANSLVGINYFNYSNPIDNNGDGFTDVTLQDRLSLFNKWNISRKSKKAFSLAGRYVYEERWGGQMNWDREFRGGDSIYAESIYTSRWELFGLYQLPVKENISFQFSTNRHSQNAAYGTEYYIADQYIGFGQLTWNKKIWNRHDLLTGLTYRYTYYDDNTTATSNADGLNSPSEMHLPGLFVQDEIMIDAQNKLLLGTRYDHNSIHGSIFSPRANYKWNSANRKHTLRLGVGNGYRVANVFTEDHAALTGARQVVFDGELLPEQSWNANLNYVRQIYEFDNVLITLDASAFYTYFHNRILPDYDTDPNKIIYSNLDGKAVSEGVSMNLDVTWTNGLKAYVGATAMNVYVEENGERERQILTEQVSGVWNIGYAFHGSGITIDYTGNLYGPMRLPLLGEHDDRPEFSPWWSIQNIQVTKRFSRYWEIYGGIKNLLDFTPPSSSIARAFDPFDKNVQFDGNGQVVRTSENPNALTFDPSYVFAPNQGIRGFLGVRFMILGTEH